MAVKSDLMVITKAKELCDYVISVTQKSPRQFRFSLVSRLQGYALDIIPSLYRANEVYLFGPDTAMKARSASSSWWIRPEQRLPAPPVEHRGRISMFPLRYNKNT